MSDYTPTTEEVRDAFSDYKEDDAGGWFKAQAGFDRWLAEVKAQERKAERERIMDIISEAFAVHQFVEGEEYTEYDSGWYHALSVVSKVMNA